MTGRSMHAAAVILALCCAGAPRCWAAAPVLEFHAPASATDPKTPALLRDLAGRLLPVYEEHDPDRYLANLSALQMAVGDYPAADASRRDLRQHVHAADAARPIGRPLIFDLYAKAKAVEAEQHIPFARAFATAYAERIPALSDLNAYSATGLLETPVSVLQQEVQQSFDQLRANDTISADQAINLIWTYLAYEAYRDFAPLVAPLDSEEDQRRYSTDQDVRIETREGVTLAAVMVRPKSPAKPLPALLEFTIYESPNLAKEYAAHGYVGVVAFTRGVRVAPDHVVPYQHDGDDARAVIDWIARQTWSDGRVAMVGDGYSGFTAWAAAKQAPPALKAITTANATAPGIDFPMEGNIPQNSGYRWSLYVTHPDPADALSFYDDALWRTLNEKWYRSGKRYRDLGLIYGRPDPYFLRWLNHPSYDRFWQTMIPYAKEFAKLDLPVLTISGYFAGSAPGALYYFNEQMRHDPHADHTLLIGPYDNGVIARGALGTMQGYSVDGTALIDLRALRYQWLDFILKDAAKPALLTDRINFEVMGTNEWHHAAALADLATSSLRFYLDGANAAADGAHRLSQHQPPKRAYVAQSVKLTDRSDAAWVPQTDLVSKSLAIHNNVIFTSDPLKKPAEFSGYFSGRLDFRVNKMDVDLNITLFELLPNGDYVRLFKPAYEFRASYTRDRVHRHLLETGVHQQVKFTSERMTSRLLQTGSRLVVVIGVNKRPDREINYGTDQDVSEESIADGRIPLKIRWYGASYIEIPVRR
jgi:putative CocE/NonD family hydrolase